MADNAADKALVARFFETFSSGNVPALLDMMQDDATWWVSGSVDGFSGTYGKEAFGALLAGVKDAYRSGPLRITPKGMIAENGKVAVEAESYGELMNGRIYNSQYHFLIETRDGKIASVKEYMDTLHAQQIFFTP